VQVQIVVTSFPPDKGALISVVGVAGRFRKVVEIEPGRCRGGQKVIQWGLGSLLVPRFIDACPDDRQMAFGLNILNGGEMFQLVRLFKKGNGGVVQQAQPGEGDQNDEQPQPTAADGPLTAARFFGGR